MTFLEIINAVLRRMRFSTVGTVGQSTYSALLQEFVNETKREVEDAWDWIQLRKTIQLTTTQGTFRYTLTGAGDRFRFLANHHGEPDVWNDTEEIFLRKAPTMRWMTARLNDDDATESDPFYFDVNGQSGGDPQVDLYPIPDGAYDLHFNMVIPQADLQNDADTLTVPHWPVVLGTWAKAMEDRGEDGGTSPNSVWKRYHDALADAIVYDRGNAAPFEDTWFVV